ncbi:MAG: hypothetical protein JJU45_03080 [Acidimicrobiia bacterium]|nr:hypothetical protein [Acidimicrobiia bacterium]
MSNDTPAGSIPRHKLSIDLQKHPPKQAPHPPARAAIRADLALSVEAIRPDAGHLTRRVVALRLLFTDRPTQALAAYRCKVHLAERGHRRSSLACHWLAVALAGTCIGPIVLDAGVRIPAGRVVLGGRTHIMSGAVIGPGASIGLREGSYGGPTLEPDVIVGARVSILGPVRVGTGATIADGSCVLDDVPAGTTVAGVPARPVEFDEAPHRQT